MAYQLPRHPRALSSLKQSRQLRSDVAFLRQLGFEHCFQLQPDQGLEQLLDSAADQALDSVDRREITGLFLYSGLNPATRPPGHGLLPHFRYPVARLADRLGLEGANAIALGQQGCSGLLSTLHLAAGMLMNGSPKSLALCAAGDALPLGAAREVMYNVMSDGAAAVLLERDAPRNQLVGFSQLSQPSYWDSPRNERELIAAYFPMATRAICRALEEAELRLSDIRWIVPSNVSWRSWTIVADLLQFPSARIWSKNIARVGHTVSCDHVINLVDMEREGALQPGDLLLLFTFGFGASWTSMIVRH